MTLIAASIAVDAADEVGAALALAQQAADVGANLIEWRIDGLAEEANSLPAALRLARESPRPCIFTCRPEREGGEYRGGDDSRISLFEALAAGDHPPRYLDVELETIQRSANLRQKVLLAVSHEHQPRDLKTSLILSAHDFRGRPADLLQRIEAMTNDDACAVIKVAWQARSLRDNLEAFEVLSQRRKPTIALCMGPFGRMSRVLAPKFGGLMTFAALLPGEETAPGQPAIDELGRLYRFDSINADTKVYGVIGWPVEHSQSPRLHNAAFAAAEFNAVYLPLPIPPEYEHFKATVGAMIDARDLDFRGASVTQPHKENLLRFVQERGGRIETIAGRAGAANTLIVNSTGNIACANTDAPAAVAALCEGMALPREALRGKRIAVLGAGGAARSVIAGLIDAGAHVTVFNREPNRATRLVKHFESVSAALIPTDEFSNLAAVRAQGSVASGATDELARGGFDAIINCTPVGMAGGPAPDVSPLPAGMPLEGIPVMDAVYSPARTPLIQQAESQGARTITGIEMFLKQAAMQFELWTAKLVPMHILRKAIGIETQH